MSKVIRARTRDKMMGFKETTSLTATLISQLPESAMIPLNEYPHIDIERLEMLNDAKSFRMPSGLTREQRHEWAKKNLQKK